jgi:hypothetical protein
MSRGQRLATVIVMLIAAMPQPGVAQTAPSTGVAVLRRMHDAYAGKWYRTLTFWQTTTMYRTTGPVVQRWYESLRYTPAAGVQLRIDLGDPVEGNGVLDTADSGWTVQKGKLVRTTADGNPFLPVIEGVYVQPVAVTARQIAALGVDTLPVTTSMWNGHPVWIVGVATAHDTMSSQLWIDPVKLVAVRMLVVLVPNRPPFDIHLDKYRRAGKGWLATVVSMFSGGKPRQVEEYHDWKAGAKIDPALFDPATWTTARHWKH